MKVKPFHWVIVAERLVFNYAANQRDSWVPVLDHIHLRIDIVVKVIQFLSFITSFVTWCTSGITNERKVLTVYHPNEPQYKRVSPPVLLKKGKLILSSSQSRFNKSIAMRVLFLFFYHLIIITSDHPVVDNFNHYVNSSFTIYNPSQVQSSQWMKCHFVTPPRRDYNIKSPSSWPTTIQYWGHFQLKSLISHHHQPMLLCQWVSTKSVKSIHQHLILIRGYCPRVCCKLLQLKGNCVDFTLI